MQSLFYHNRSGANAYTGNLDTKAVRNAITLHPLKRPEFMYRLHSHFMELKIQQNSYDLVVLQRQLDRVDRLIKKGKLFFFPYARMRAITLSIFIVSTEIMITS